MAAYSITYKFNPNDPMWILDNNSVKKATCLQINIKIIPSSITTFENEINYIALLDCNKGTIVVAESNAYTSLDEAIAALQNNIQTQTC